MAVNRRIFVLAFVGFLVLTNCIFVLLWGNFYTSSDKVQTPLSNVTPVVILKLPRSGSSWFTSLFNQLEYVYVTKEIVQGKDKDLYNTNTLLTHLIKALSEPSSKIAFSSFKYLSGRYWEDFIFKGKLRTSLRILGFTLNPEHVSGIFLSRSDLITKIIFIVFLYISICCRFRLE